MTLVEGKRNVYRDWIGKPETNRPLGRPEHKRKYNIKKDLKEIRREDIYWIHMAQSFLPVFRFYSVSVITSILINSSTTDAV
jgi:hypothetical protein